ncbi:MAG: C1 family peptidase [Pyrinomonadaceae bacterium]
MKSYRWLMLVSALVLTFVTVLLAPLSHTSGQDISQKLGPLNQQVDYIKREQIAPPEIKARLTTLRQQLQTRNRRFTVGYTTAADVPIEVLAGTKIPRGLPGVTEKVNTRARELMTIDRAEQQRAIQVNPNIFGHLQIKCSASLKSWDWRKSGKVTPVKSQICGTCWDFTSMGAYEGSYAIRNNQMIDASEQHILNCASAGSCAGGWWMPVFDYMISNGTDSEAAHAFTGNDSLSCPTGHSTPYRATAWGFVGSNYTQIPPVGAIKQSLCEHGPNAIAVMVDSPFQHYTGGVFDETDQHFDWINHGVTLIGWDDTKGAWLIKNSWGTGWGETGGFGSEKGYMWISYGSNNIGIATAWVDAKSRFYRLPIDWMKVLERDRLIVKPLPDPDPGPIVVRPDVVRPRP